MSSGYVKSWRKELESDIWLMPPLYGRVWQWLKLTANYKEKALPQPDGSVFIIKPGQRLTSYRQIAQAVAWQEGRKQKRPHPETLARILNWLQANFMITIEHGQCDREYTLITLVNWELYQGSDSDGVTVSSTVTEQAMEHRVKQNNKDKNIYYSPSDFETAEWIFFKLKEMNPKHRQPNLKSWANTIRLTREQDGRTDQEIRELFTWANQDSFWKTVVLSPGKLREKWDALVIKKTNGRSSQSMNSVSNGAIIV